MEVADTITKTYNQIKLALTHKLTSQGYLPVHEEHHDAVFDSRYIIWSNNSEALRLTWDGKENWFILEITEDLPIRTLTHWDEIVLTPFNAQKCSETDINAVTASFLDSLS